MIVLVMVLLAALAAGAVAAYVLGVDAGYVLFTWQGWVLESTLAGFALLLLAVWLAFTSALTPPGVAPFIYFQF